MPSSTIYPNGNAEFTIAASSSLQISNYGGGIAQIYYLIETANTPAAYQLQQTLEDGLVTLGPFTVETQVKIESNNSKVIYEVDPTYTGVGDAATLGGQPPIYYAVDADVIHDNGDETIDGKKSFIDIVALASDIHHVVGSVASDGSMRVYHNSAAGTFSLTPYASSSLISNKQIIWTAGSAEWSIEGTPTVGGNAILKANGVSGSFTTVDGKTVTVVDGQITSIV